MTTAQTITDILDSRQALAQVLEGYLGQGDGDAIELIDAVIAGDESRHGDFREMLENEATLRLEYDRPTLADAYLS